VYGRTLFCLSICAIGLRIHTCIYINIYIILCIVESFIIFDKTIILISLSRVYGFHYVCLNDIIIVNYKLENDNVPLLKKKKHYVGRPISRRRSRTEYNIILLLRCNIESNSVI